MTRKNKNKHRMYHSIFHNYKDKEVHAELKGLCFFSCPEVNTKSPIPNFWFMIPLLGMRNFHHPQTVYQVGPVLQIAPITSNNYGL
jgi:hypothetical protein